MFLLPGRLTFSSMLRFFPPTLRTRLVGCYLAGVPSRVVVRGGRCSGFLLVVVIGAS